MRLSFNWVGQCRDSSPVVLVSQWLCQHLMCLLMKLKRKCLFLHFCFDLGFIIWGSFSNWNNFNSRIFTYLPSIIFHHLSNPTMFSSYQLLESLSTHMGFGMFCLVKKTSISESTHFPCLFLQNLFSLRRWEQQSIIWNR